MEGHKRQAGKSQSHSHTNISVSWTSGRQIQILPVIFVFLFFAKTVSHKNYLYQITKLKLKP